MIKGGQEPRGQDTGRDMQRYVSGVTGAAQGYLLLTTSLSRTNQTCS